MARLFQFLPSPFCAKVRKILEYKGIEFEAIEVDYLERKELIAASGQITVPALTLPGGETIVDSGRIATRLEELFPEPTIFPPSWRGMHIAMARYIESEVEEAIFRVKIPDTMEYWRLRGADRLAMWRYVRERKYGAGFCDRMVREREANLDRVREVLSPFEDALGDRPFLFRRIGLADFSLYGTLHSLAFTGELKIPAEFPALRAFYGRIDRITASIEAA
ncbi:MAG: glutathione S-transferase family protein [Candidatus Binatales bacterium]